MIRNLKVLGLALVAVFAFSAMVASAASAQTAGKLTSTGPVTLTGEEIEGQTNSFEAFGAAPITCPGSKYTGHKYNVTPHEYIPAGPLDPAVTTATITPHYVHCRFEAADDTTVDMNGCDYVFHIGNTTATSTFAVTADVVCSGSNRIRVTKPGCDVEVGAQTGLSGTMVLKHTNSGGADDIDLEGAFTNVHATTEAACLDLSSSTAKLTSHVTITGHNENDEPTAVTVTD